MFMKMACTNQKIWLHQTRMSMGKKERTKEGRFLKKMICEKKIQTKRLYSHHTFYCEDPNTEDDSHHCLKITCTQLDGIWQGYKYKVCMKIRNVKLWSNVFQRFDILSRWKLGLTYEAVWWRWVDINQVQK